MADVAAFVRLSLRSQVHLAAENMFLRKQLALYLERHVRPRRADPATRVALVLLARRLEWRSMLTVVKPDLDPITVGFRVLYVFVVLEVGTRRIVHWNVTSHPTAEWTIQQFRAVITGEVAHRFLVHDRDTLDAPAVDRAVESMGLRVLKNTRPDAAGQRLL